METAKAPIVRTPASSAYKHVHNRQFARLSSLRGIALRSVVPWTAASGGLHGALAGTNALQERAEWQ